MDAFTTQYLETALWASTDHDGEPLDKNYTTDDFAPETLAQAKKDCDGFQATYWDDISALGVMQAGHDFFLTRNGHGAGFWDGDWPEDAGRRLTEASRAYGEWNLYVGDDGKLYA